MTEPKFVFKHNSQQEGKPVFRPLNQPNPKLPTVKTREEDMKYKRAEDKPDARRNRGWNALIRVSAFLAALSGMYISAQFSVDGFSITVPDREWVGWGLAIILIVIQSAWQKFGDNLTIFVLAMICYIYGIATNVIGIMGNRGGTHNVVDFIIPVVFGVLLEVFPEPFLAWSISGDVSSDPLKKFVERWS
jgi:hypothetical protein